MELHYLSKQEIKDYEEKKSSLDKYTALIKHKEMLQMMAEGLTSVEIGAKVFLSHTTILGKVDKLKKITRAKNIANLMYIAMKLNVVE